VYTFFRRTSKLFETKSADLFKLYFLAFLKDENNKNLRVKCGFLYLFNCTGKVAI